MKLTWEQKQTLSLIGHGLPSKIRTERIEPRAHPKQKVSAGFSKSKKTGKVTELFVMVPCSCFPCEAYRRSIALCKLNTGRHLAYTVATLANGEKLTKAMVLPEPLPEPKFFKNKSLPEHVHVRRRLHQTLSRYLP